MLREWFVNRPDGLEHGFTVPEPPDGDRGLLVLELALIGDLRPAFAEDGQAVDFYGGGSVGVLRYGKLEVKDATGTALPARMEPGVGGLRIVVEDETAVYPVTVDPLATTAAWTATGEAENDGFGCSVATAGDVDGDGYADVVVGASGNDSYRGKAYLYLGGPAGLATTAAWTGSGEAAGDYFGSSVATAGDVNGDGYADVVIGAYNNNGATGKAYLFLGGPAGLATAAAWTAAGEATYDQFGSSVAAAGDVNGDGYADVIVGASGKAYLYLGGSAGLATTAAWTAAGEVAGDAFGSAVATAGDVNGDGYADVVVGAYADNNGTGKAYLYLGGPAGLAATAAWTATGEAGYTYFGSAVATAGDVNGDGYADVVVGAWGNNGGVGKAYLYLGGSSGLTSTAAWTASGEASNNWFGYSLATAGDVNGDGYADVLIGARGYGGFSGKAYLYLGGPAGLTSTAAWTVSGEGGGNTFGYSVATAGDVNGDGYADVVAGADTNSSSRGKACLYLGGPGGLTATPAWTSAGVAASDFFGYSVATAGDVNGDGYADVVVGAYGNNSNRGKAYLYLGGPTGLATTAAWTATGEATNDGFGRSVATAGDVNGDGYADVVVGADSNNSNRGKAYLYLGGPAGLATTAAWTATGEAYGYFGHSLATAGDVNGDGYADVVVGAHYINNYRGKAYLYLGGLAGLGTTAAWTATGEADSDSFGYSVATAGDVNGDGYADVLIGARGYSSSSGKAYLYLGGPAGLATAATWTATGGANYDYFGYSVATAGDVNGDGYADVVIGAPYNNSSTGRAYVYLGGSAGLAATAAWTATGQAAQGRFGSCVATTGDVNGDGYADVIVYGNATDNSDSKAYVFIGGAGGLGTSAAWVAVYRGGMALPPRRRVTSTATATPTSSSARPGAPVRTEKRTSTSAAAAPVSL